jgi:hypothetical protein
MLSLSSLPLFQATITLPKATATNNSNGWLDWHLLPVAAQLFYFCTRCLDAHTSFGILTKVPFFSYFFLWFLFIPSHNSKPGTVRTEFERRSKGGRWKTGLERGNLLVCILHVWLG